MKLFMRALAVYTVTCFGIAAAAFAADEITGAGSTFAYPLYAKWGEAYQKQTGIKLKYQSIGSGAGINLIKKGDVNFGASDMPLEPAELEKDGLVQFPTAIGGVVPVVNLKGFKPGEIKLTGEVLAQIYLGKITKWNHQEIAKLNEGIKLPPSNITPVHRTDGSGTTFVFTNYLSKISPEWKRLVGSNVIVFWPTGVGGNGNEGVASNVRHIPGSIGYVEYAYVLQNNMTYTMMQNQEGQFINPNGKSFQEAAAGADWANSKDFYVVLTDQPGKETWPISGATFILMHKVQKDRETAKRLLDFFTWAYQDGGRLAGELSYVALPADVVDLIHKEWKTELKGPDGNSI
jgi:phosphate transport system substrate-binding protein